MTIAKKITITTESHEVFILRVNGKSDVRGFCNKCATDAELLTLDQAVSLVGMTTIEIVSRIETGSVHFWETANGHLFLCQNSLKKFLSRGSK